MRNIIQQHRERLGLSQAELARKASVSRVYVHHLETGFRTAPSLAVLNALAAALSLTAEERAELILHFADRQGAAVGTADTEQMLPVNGDEVEAA